MIVVEQHNVELDYCTNCSGVWFDSGELEIMMETQGISESEFSIEKLVELSPSETKEKKRRCPICGKKMKKIELGQNPEVMVDVCPIGEGIWFDGGEVRQVIKHFAKKQLDERGIKERVFTFLGDAFQAESS
jgi:Zn-finger nucleic acid-binding protein